MALMERKYCQTCKQIETFSNGTCSTCMRKLERELTARFESKTTDEKLNYLYSMIRGIQKGQEQKLF